jgi:membrane protein implicated in regulation of membrane protease activity
MTWADFYLVCFALGFVFSLLSFLLGGLDWHLPFHAHVPHLGGPSVHVGHGMHAGHASAGHGHSGGSGLDISPFNPVTLAAFLAWFGGTGYLLTRFWSVWFVMGFGIALLSGLAGAGCIFLFLSKVLMSRGENLDPTDYEMIGVLGRISVPIRETGTGEIIYSQGGTRRTCGARAENHTAIAKGSEVLVTRYEKGIAYVRPWDEMSGEEPAVEMDGGDPA